MERFVIVWFKFEFLFPRKRVFKSVNAFREWVADYYYDFKPGNLREARKERKRRRDASLERAVLISEAQERGDYSFDASNAVLITVEPASGGGRGKGSTPDGNGKKPKKEKEKKVVKSALQKQAELIEVKMTSHADYVLTPREHKILKKWKLKQLEIRKAQVNKKKKAKGQESTKISYRRRAKSTVPRSTQDTIPVVADYIEGLFEVSPNKYSKMFRIKDINYSTAKNDDQILVFCKLSEFYNYFSEDINVQVVIDNRFVSESEKDRDVLYPVTGGTLDKHVIEYNRVIKGQMVAGRNDMAIEKFVVVTIDADTAIEAILRFHKIQTEVIDLLRKIGVAATLMSTTERLSYYHDKFRRGREGELVIDFDSIKERGISSLDYIAPSFMIFENKHFMIEDDCYRILCVSNLPATLSDEFLYELYNNDFPVTASLSIQPVAQDKALKIVNRQLTGIKHNKIEAEKRAVKGGYTVESIQHSIKDSFAQAEALLEDMMKNSQKLFFVTITFMVHGESLDELNDHCKIIEGKARKYTAQLRTLTAQQEEGYKITLPFGYLPKDVKVDRALTSESTSILMPFSNQELFQPGGFYYGLNQISSNLVIVNRTAMKTPSGFVLGSSGSGKSFASKREMLNVLLNSPDTGLIVIDPENEYGGFARAFGGTVLSISSSSDVHLNPMDMSEDYGLDDDDGPNTAMVVKVHKALSKKSEYLMSIVERMMSTGNSYDMSLLNPVQKTIVDRCVTRCYAKYLALDEYSNEAMLAKGSMERYMPFDPDNIPTFVDLQCELNKEKEYSEDARQVAESVEYYSTGRMDLFAHKTNVDINNRFVVFNVRDLGPQLQQVALIVIFDFIWNRMIANKNRGVRTYCYCDEIHVLFRSYYSAEFLRQLYKRGRKYGLCITGMTQNVEDLLRSEQARGMISNSDFVMMLNQSSEDLALLTNMLNISDTQAQYVIGADAGCGLLFAEKVIVPFVDRFPDDSYLYKLMSTKFGEEMSDDDVARTIADIVGKGA
jgi:hypothetical protein